MTGHSTSESENDARKRLGEVFNDIFYERQLDRLTSEEFKAAVEKMRAETPAILIGFCSRCAVDTLARMEWWVEAKKKATKADALDSARRQDWSFAMKPWDDLATLRLIPAELQDRWVAAASGCEAKMPQLTALVEAAALKGIVSAAAQQDDASGAPSTSTSSASRGTPRL